MPIDFVLTWVDGNDPELKKKRAKYSGESLETMNGEERFVDYGTLNYWFRCVEVNAPWVRKIFLITDRQIPKWLNTAHPKLQVVFHDEFIPAKYLPTFNSNVIEFNIHRISDLSDHFVLFNDDVFINAPVTPDDFFQNGMPKYLAILNPIQPTGDFAHIQLNNAILLNSVYNKKSVLKAQRKKFFNRIYGKQLVRTLLQLPYSFFDGFYEPHIADPYDKDAFANLWERFPKQLDEVCQHRFRTTEDISHWLVKEIEICEGRFEPQSPGFGRYVTLNETKTFKSEIAQHTHKILCVNDKDNEYGALVQLQRILQMTYPKHSSFERTIN